MKKRLGCLHAHHSNIDYIDQALSPYGIELIHFVDPGLMHKVASDKNFQEADAQNKVKEQIEWITQCNVDAVLITCTNYIAVLQEDQLSVSVPIIKIDEPYFEYICNIQEPQIILFSNPATVEGTLERLYQYANNREKSLHIEALIIENTFELLLQGQKGEYNQEIFKFINQIVQKENKVISVAQLSMVDAARQVELKTSVPIINPLDTLISEVVYQLKVDKNSVIN